MTAKLVLLLCVCVAVCVRATPPNGVLSPKDPPPSVGADAGLSAGIVDAVYMAAIGVKLDTKTISQTEFEAALKDAMGASIPSCTPNSKDGKALAANSGRCATGHACSDAGGVILRGNCNTNSVCCIPAKKEVSWNEAKATSATSVGPRPPRPTGSVDAAGGNPGGGLGADGGAPPAPPAPNGTTTVTTSNNVSYTATPAFKISSVPFAPTTAVYWPLQWANPAERNYSVICYAKDATNGIQQPATPVAGTAGSCKHSGKKQCYACGTRKFLAARKSKKGTRYHSGIDLYAPKGTPVVAAEDGDIVNVYPFFENVCCVIVQTKSGIVINYGEISCNLEPGVEIGKPVKAGQKIGEVGHLKCCHPMMHFETYIKGTTQNLRSYPGAISASLLNPTEYLLNALEFGK